jgi:hypothetical protein
VEHRERQKGKKNDRESTILKYITSVQVEDITICIESCWIIGDGRKGVRESYGRGWTDKSKVYSQLGNIEKPLCILTLELILKDCKIGTGGACERGKINGGEEGEGIWWWTSYTYMK